MANRSEKSPVDRFLSLFGEVKAGESARVLLFTLLLFLLLSSYYIIKTVREPLVIAAGGAELKSYAAAGQAIFLILFVPLYSWFAVKVRRMRLVIGLTLFFIAGFTSFYFLSSFNDDRTDGFGATGDEVMRLATAGDEAPPLGAPLEGHRVELVESPEGYGGSFRIDVDQSRDYVVFASYLPMVLGEEGEEVPIEAGSWLTVTDASGEPLELTRSVEGDWHDDVSVRWSMALDEGSYEFAFAPVVDEPMTISVLWDTRARIPLLGFFFYIFVGVFSLSIIAQMWSFANDLYRPDEGERLFPIIQLGANVGAIVGSGAAAVFFAIGIGSYEMLLVAAGVLALSLGFYAAISRTADTAPEAQVGASADRSDPLAFLGGFKLVAQSKYLRMIALLLILLNLVNTTGEFILSSFIEDAAAEAAAGADNFDAAFGSYIGQFYGSFFGVVNIVTLTIQGFIVSRLVKFLGMRGVLLALPVVALGAYGLAAVGVGLSVFRIVKMAENSTDYSVMNTAKALLWLPTTKEEKYQAKQAVDTFFVRLGDVLSAGLVAIGLNTLSFTRQHFAMVNVGIIALWIFIAIALAREYGRLKAAQSKADPETVDAVE